MISSIQSLAALSLPAIASGIIQCSTVTQSAMSSSVEKRRTFMFVAETSRLATIADSCKNITDAEFLAEAGRISCILDSYEMEDDPSIVDSDMILCLPGIMIVLCMVIMLLHDYFMVTLGYDTVCEKLNEEAEVSFHTECIHLSKLIDIISDESAFSEECTRLGPLLDTIDKSYLFVRECNRMTNLAATIDKSVEFERECLRLSKLSRIVGSEDAVESECTRLSNLLDIEPLSSDKEEPHQKPTLLTIYPCRIVLAMAACLAILL